MTGRHPIRAVSRLTGLSIDTLRSWERRYEAVVPERSDRGRMYSDEQVQHLLKLRRAQSLGYAIGTIARLNPQELDALILRPAGSPQSRTSPETPSSLGQLDRVLHAVESFDILAIERHLIHLATWLDPGPFANEVVLPLMRAIGDGWHSGRFNVSQEHIVSAALRNVIGTMVRGVQNPSSPRTILITSPAGELHEFGLLAAALIAASRHFSVLYLGTNLPAREIAESTSRLQPAILLVGVSTENPAPNIHDEVRLLATLIEPKVHLWVGGPSAGLLESGISRARLTAIPDFESFEKQVDEFPGT